MTEGSEERGVAGTSAGEGEGETASRGSWLRRGLRSRTVRAAAAAGVVGVLLGAGTVAWQTDTLPLLKPAPCWDSLDDKVLTGFFGDRRLEVEEQKLQPDPRDYVTRSWASCRITGYRGDDASRQLRLRVHRLDGLFGRDAKLWPGEYLASRMVELGGGLPGQVSGTRGWLALPESCTGKTGENTGPVVVDVATGAAFADAEYSEPDRAALGRALVRAANGVMGRLGCTDTYAVPESFPDVAEWQGLTKGDVCGVKGLDLPADLRETHRRTRLGGGDDTARVCEVGQDRDSYALRLLTVRAAGLSAIYRAGMFGPGTRLEGTKGSGMLTTDRATYWAKCPSGEVVFMVEHDLSGGSTLHAELLPAYVAAEAERIGCGPVRVELPAP